MLILATLHAFDELLQNFVDLSLDVLEVYHRLYEAATRFKVHDLMWLDVPNRILEVNQLDKVFLQAACLSFARSKLVPNFGLRGGAI